MNIVTSNTENVNRENHGCGDGFINPVISSRESQPYMRLNLYPRGCKAKRLVKSKAVFINRNERGKIFGFSRSSQRRLKQKLMELDWETYAAPRANCKYSRSFWCTLTYPEEFPTDRNIYKRDLQTFKKRLLREYKIQSVIWKQEYQKRNAVHFHLLIFFKNHENISKYRKWASQAWYDVVNSGDYYHYQAGVSTDVVHREKGLARLFNYLGKYISKVQKMEFETGRVWGYWGDLPLVLAVIITLTRAQLVRFLRRVRRWG